MGYDVGPIFLESFMTILRSPSGYTPSNNAQSDNFNEGADFSHFTLQFRIHKKQLTPKIKGDCQELLQKLSPKILNSRVVMNLSLNM